MKIVHISNYFNDSIGYHENILPRYQKLLGHDVCLITSDRDYLKPKGNTKYGAYYNEEGILIKRLKTRYEFKYRFVIFEHLYESIEDEKPDYIFHHGITQPSLFTVSEYKKKHPSVFVVADNHADLNISGRNIIWKILFYNTFCRMNLKKIINDIDIVFGVTPARCYFAYLELGIPKNKIRFLPQGCDINEAEKYKKIDRNKEDNNYLSLITGGKYIEDKGLVSLIEGIRNMPVKLNIFGVIKNNYLFNLIEKQKNINYVGWQDREGIFKNYANSDVAIWPKLHTTLIEDAIAMDLPVILRYYGSTCHLIRGNGFYLFSGKANEINYIIRYILNNKKIIEEFKKCAKKMRSLLSYYEIAKESIDYYYDSSPQKLHNIFFNDLLCKFENTNWYKLIA